jgi:hypothetical protein
MSKRAQLSCDDCYFRQSGLCALRVDTPCPTFRHAARGSLTPPGQAPLIARQVEPRLVARHQAA